MMRWRGACVLAGLLACASATAAAEAPVTLRVSVDRTDVVIGEPIRYVVRLEHPEEISAAFPSFGAAIGELAVEAIGSAPPRRRAGSLIEERWYRLSSYATGSYTLPEPVATYRSADGADHDVRGESITVTVNSLLPADWESQDIRGAKPLLPFGSQWWVWAAAALALLIASAWVWAKRRRRAPDAPAIPQRSPHEIALEALERLHRDGLLAAGRHEDHFMRLSTIVRTYIEGRFSLRAPEMTTEEFLQAAAQAQSISYEQRQLLQEFLVQCDLVKFARYQPSAGEGEDALAAARRFVLETVPQEAAEAAGNRASA